MAPATDDPGVKVTIGAADAFMPLTVPVSHAPQRGETGLVLNGRFIPLRERVFASTGDVFFTGAPRLSFSQPDPWIWPWNQWVPARDVAGAALRASFTYVPNGTGTAPIHQVLDTPLPADTDPEDAANPAYFPNPGCDLLSPTHLYFPTSDEDATDIEWEAAAFPWRGTASWAKTGEATGTLALSADNDAVDLIEYTTGSGNPDTTYSGAIAISATAAVRFHFKSGSRWSPIYTQHVTFDGGDAPASFSKVHPRLAYTADASGTNLDGSDNHEGVQYRYEASTTTTYPHPEVRDTTVPPSFTFSGTSATGTQYLGDGFLPILSGETKPTRHCYVNTMAYRYGHLLGFKQHYVTVKIGKLTASWDGTETLTLGSSMVGATIEYQLNGGSVQTYSAPLTITETKTVKFWATKANCTGSDSFTFDVTFEGTPPAAFDLAFWSDPSKGALGATLTGVDEHYVAGERNVVVTFQERPKYYITPTGTGDGLSPGSPSNMTTIIGTTASAGSAASGDTVWASAGTYTNPTGTESTYWKVVAGVTLKGGYNEDFTERDVQAHKTVIDAVTWNTGANVNTSIMQVDGIADGLWGEGEPKLNTAYGNHAYVFPHLFTGINFRYCHVTAELDLVPDDTSTWSIDCQAFSFINSSGTSPASQAYGCTADLDFSIADAVDGAAGASGGLTSYGGGGGSSRITVEVFRFVGYGYGNGWNMVIAYCDVTVNAVVGDGGDGGDGGSIVCGTTTYSEEYEGEIYEWEEPEFGETKGGTGGSAEAYVKVGICATNDDIGLGPASNATEHNNLAVAAEVGLRGSGGDGGAVTISGGYGTTVGGGIGWYNKAQVLLGFRGDYANISAAATAGGGGKDGDSGTSNDYGSTTASPLAETSAATLAAIQMSNGTQSSIFDTYRTLKHGIYVVENYTATAGDGSVPCTGYDSGGSPLTSTYCAVTEAHIKCDGGNVDMPSYAGYWGERTAQAQIGKCYSAVDAGSPACYVAMSTGWYPLKYHASVLADPDGEVQPTPYGVSHAYYAPFALVNIWSQLDPRSDIDIDEDTSVWSVKEVGGNPDRRDGEPYDDHPSYVSINTATPFYTDGVPIDGYETPGTSGTAFGRFWE